MSSLVRRERPAQGLVRLPDDVRRVITLLSLTWSLRARTPGQHQQRTYSVLSCPPEQTHVECGTASSGATSLPSPNQSPRVASSRGGRPSDSVQCCNRSTTCSIPHPPSPGPSDDPRFCISLAHHRPHRLHDPPSAHPARRSSALRHRRRLPSLRRRHRHPRQRRTSTRPVRDSRPSASPQSDTPCAPRARSKFSQARAPTSSSTFEPAAGASSSYPKTASACVLVPPPRVAPSLTRAHTLVRSPSSTARARPRTHSSCSTRMRSFRVTISRPRTRSCTASL